MLYRIRLRIDYEYERPVAHGRHLICVMPKSIPDVQTVKDSRLEITPAPDERIDRYDHFGNAVTEIGFRTRHSGIAVAMDAHVDRQNVPPPQPEVALSDLPGVLARSRDVLADAPLNFLAPSPRVTMDPAISDFARSAVVQGAAVSEVVLAVGQAIHNHMTFDPEATEVSTPANVAFEDRRGVCQDFSHIMLAALRSLKVPCCYVSGYLRTLPPKGMPRLEGADAMHAWVRAWCGPETGWIEYDPTNETIAGEDHIAAAIGRDYSDVSPIKGILRTSGGQKSRQRVDVTPI